MPVAGKIYTKRVELTGYDEEAYVVITTNPKADLWLGTEEVDKVERNALVMSRVILEWNFTDEAGVLLPVTKETVQSTLSMFDYAKIEEALGIIADLSDSKNQDISLA